MASTHRVGRDSAKDVQLLCEGTGPFSTPFPHPTAMRIALAQINTVVGDVDENARRAAAAISRARHQGASLTLLPELVLGGYPPEDLLLRPEFAAATRSALAAPPWAPAIRDRYPGRY